MNDGLKYFIFLAFAMMVLQSFLSYLQYKSYQKAVSALQGKGWILGIAMWKRFEDVDDYNGMTLNEVRKIGIEEDLAINPRLREKEPYSPLLVFYFSGFCHDGSAKLFILSSI